jgi:hypothetical protein
MKMAVILSVLAESKILFVQLQHKVLKRIFRPERERHMNKYETGEHD